MDRPTVAEPSSPSPSSIDDDIHLQPGVQETGQPATLIRDTKGRLVYPGYVPPPILSPMPGRLLQHEAPPPLSHEGPRKAATDPHILQQTKSEGGKRPSMGPKALTDASRRTNRRGSALPVILKRAGTNVSQLQQELWQRNDGDGEDSTTSESSTDDEDDDDIGAGIDRTDHQTRQQQMADRFRRFRVGNDNYKTTGKVSKRDGRLAISIKDTSNKGYLAKALGTAVSKVVPIRAERDAFKREQEAEHAQGGKQPARRRPSSETTEAPPPCPRLNIVVMVIGSRGDIQPFLKLGKVLREQFGHR